MLNKLAKLITDAGTTARAISEGSFQYIECYRDYDPDGCNPYASITMNDGEIGLAVRDRRCKSSYRGITTVLSLAMPGSINTVIKILELAKSGEIFDFDECPAELHCQIVRL